MQKKALAVLIGSLTLMSINAFAVTIDVRHEYTDDSKINRDRAMMAHRFDNGFGLSFETKWKSSGKHPDKPFYDIVSDGSETIASYQYQSSLNVISQVGVAFESGSDLSIYKPYLQLNYKLNDQFYTNARYRYEYVRNVKESANNEHINRLDLWLGYNLEAWLVEYNFTYRFSDKYRFDNKKRDYEHDVKLSYSIDQQWVPYIEVGNAPVRKDTDERQTRYRIGVQYSF